MRKEELDQKREEGLRRYRIIAPLLEEGLARCERLQIRRQGLSGREIKAQQKQVVSRRFNRVGRNTLWQADLKYGPYLPSPKLRIRHLNTKAYSPESKGKCEKFNQTVDEFIREVQLEKPRPWNGLMSSSGPGCRKGITTGYIPL